MITLQDLQMYQAIAATISGLEAEIKAIYESSAAPDAVRGGRVSSKKISDPTARKAMAIVAKREELEKKQKELEERAERIREWIETVEDPRIGQICRMHYVEGMSWSKVCLAMYGYKDNDYCRKIIRRYFRKVSDLSASECDISMVNKKAE